VTVTVWPATISDPVRAAPVVFGDAENVAAPVPVPAPLVIVSQSGLLLVAPHEHVAVVVTVTLPDAPLAATGCVGGVTLYAQAAASWFTVSVLLAMVTVPVRAGPGLDATDTLTVPFPVPDPGGLTVSQSALDGPVVQPQLADVVTVTDKEPPVAVIG
jgi:hypothetical protein